MYTFGGLLGGKREGEEREKEKKRRKEKRERRKIKRNCPRTREGRKSMDGLAAEPMTW